MAEGEMAAERIEILLVEDDEDDALIVRELLAAVGVADYVVTVRASLAAALEHLGRSRADLVLLDLTLPDSRGIETVRRMRAEGPVVPIIVLTGQEEETGGLAAVQAGAQDFLSKNGFDGETLSRAIRYAIEREATERELIAARQASEQANRAKTEFLSRLSHELRTPLHVILGVTEELALTGLGEAQREQVAVLQRAGRSILRLVDDTLDLSKIESGGIEFARATFDPATLVRQAGTDLGRRAEQRGLALRVEVGEDVPARVVGDPERLRQVLDNLIVNALKFTRAGEVVVVLERSPPGRPGAPREAPTMRETGAAREAAKPPAAREVGGRGRAVAELLFSVADTGPGVPEASRHRIFESFMQLERRADEERGSGLGLAISARIVSSMGGQLWVEERPGGGSLFRFTACLETAASEESAAARADAEGGDAEEEGRRVRVLLAEDHAEVQQLVRLSLRGRPFDLVIVGNGAAAVDVIRRGEAFDVVLMDLQMPVRDGLWATREIRRWEAEVGREPLPIVAVTAYASGESRRESKRAGCTAHLTKPFRRRELLDAVDSALTHRGQTFTIEGLLREPEQFPSTDGGGARPL